MSRLAKKRIIVIAVAVAIVAALPFAFSAVNGWLTAMRQSALVADYDRVVEGADSSERDQMLAAAERYNAELTRTGVLWHMSDEQTKTYESLLDVDGAGMMGYIKIPKIGISLPIYHSTEDSVLKDAIGHIAGTSLPVGGRGTHCSITGHRGMPNSTLFTDIGMLEKGDVFSLHVLGRVLSYEVDQVRVVLPSNLTDLAIDPDQDYVTLVTCTPYGVNSHRLLVRGHRVDDAYAARALGDAEQVQPNLVAAILAVLLLVALGIVLVLVVRLARRKSTSHEGE